MKIEGNAQNIDRFITGMYSFDKAWENARKEIGFPLTGVLEIAGPTHCGKSTIAYSLAAMLGKYIPSDISLLDFEGFDKNHLQDIMENQGFDGTLKLIQKDPNNDESLGDDLIDAMRDEKKTKGCDIGIMDSIGAISPISERDGELGEANMGRRAKLLAQFMRKYINIARMKNKNLILINHLHPNIGAPGLSTPGGVTIDYLSAMRVRLKRKEEFKDGSYAIEGTVTKNRWGYVRRQFYIVVLAGFGIHRGLTAFYDACLFAKDRVSRTTTVKVDGESVGRVSEIFKKAYLGDDTFFDVFRNALSSAQSVEEVEDENEAQD